VRSSAAFFYLISLSPIWRTSMAQLAPQKKTKNKVFGRHCSRTSSQAIAVLPFSVALAATTGQAAASRRCTGAHILGGHWLGTFAVYFDERGGDRAQAVMTRNWPRGREIRALRPPVWGGRQLWLRNEPEPRALPSF